MTYFKNVNTIEELRRQYKELLKKYHPDNKDGSTEATQEINSEYEMLFKRLKDIHESKTSNKEESENKTSAYDSMKYNFEEDELLREMLNKVINYEGITIEIIGNWLWLGGNTYQYRKDFKELGFKFAGNKKMWYWHSEAFRKRSHKKLTINQIRDYYGSTEIEKETKILIGA